MEVRRSRSASDEVVAALLERLPLAEFVLSFAERAGLVVDVRDGAGAVRAVAVVVEEPATLSGAPVLVALLADDIPAGAALADALLPLSTAPGGLELLGPGTAAREAATRIAAAVGATTRRVMGQRLLVATSVTIPADVPGRCRPMTIDDHELVATWLDEFVVEALHAPAPRGREHWLPQVARAQPDVRLWEHDGTVRTMVLCRRTTPVSSRLGQVYTPPEHRGRGYAAACTAHVTREALAAGDERVVLTTDVENPTSNRLYRRLGFEDVGSHASWWVGPA